LRKDVLAFLAYLDENKVTGTQATGNLTRKAILEISARMVKPPVQPESADFRREEEVWPVYFIHLLAHSAGLVAGGQSQRWRTTPAYQEFLAAPSAIAQVYLLFAAWWLRTDWSVTYVLEMRGEVLDVFRQAAAALLLETPSGKTIPLDPFSDRLIETAGLSLAMPDSNEARRLLRLAVRWMVMAPLSAFRAVELAEADSLTASDPIWGKSFTFQVTPFGVGLLKTLKPV
jgi:hypothetical protein